MIEQQVSTIDYYVWLLSDWAYLGGARFVQMAARHGLKINHIPMRMQDVYAGSGGVLLADRSWQRQAYRIHELKRWSAKLGINGIMASIWAEDANPADPEVLTALASRHGLDGAALLAEAATAPIREEYGK